MIDLFILVLLFSSFRLKSHQTTTLRPLKTTYPRKKKRDDGIGVLISLYKGQSLYPILSNPIQSQIPIQIYARIRSDFVFQTAPLSEKNANAYPSILQHLKKGIYPSTTHKRCRPTKVPLRC